ncbi:acetyl-CoA carboxylase biotin carboxylase subunit family protein [Streptomyces sp. NPDC059456]|uniref:ATP-grasp domain-containing protein n=1 Tax=Streptomyces sp. NPDC059456 TaxID=3346838 RepID=UPI0036836058
MNAPTAGPARPVLVVGWKAKAVKALVRHGAEVTSVVAPDEAAKCRRLGLGATLVAADTARAEDVAAALARHGRTAAEYDVVCSPQELTVQTAAMLGAAPGNTAIPMPVALALRDKAVQKAAVRAAGLPVARCHVVPRTAGLAAVAADGPVVVKPVNGAGSADTHRVGTPQEGAALADRLTAQGLPGPWLVEEFVHGSELQVDGVVRGGELLLLSVSRYLDNVILIHDGGVVGSASLSPAGHPALYERTRALAARALAALGFTDGVFHMEVFSDGERIVFSEVGGRVGGALTDEQLRHGYGVDIYDEWARAVLGLPSALTGDQAAPVGSVGYIHLTVAPGKVAALPSEQELAARPGVLHAELDVEVGDTVGDLSASSHLRAARVLVRGTDDVGVAADLRALSTWFRGATVIVPAS